MLLVCTCSCLCAYSWIHQYSGSCPYPIFNQYRCISEYVYSKDQSKESVWCHIAKNSNLMNKMKFYHFNLHSVYHAG